MQVNGVVISCEMNVQVLKKDGGYYPGTRLAYRDDTGKMCEQNFHNNTFNFNSALKAKLSNLKLGDKISIIKEKEGEFWNVKAINLQGETPTMPDKDIPASGKTNPYQSPKSTYETPEERAKKQVYIIRQSSIANAIALAATHKATATVENILQDAKTFEDYVLGTNVNFNTEELQGDEAMVM